MDDLTNEERRFVLMALWRWRDQIGQEFTDVGEAGSEGIVDHELAAMAVIESAVRKLGGDPEAKLFGAPRF